jgi:hypothetical protein
LLAILIAALLSPYPAHSEGCKAEDFIWAQVSHGAVAVGDFIFLWQSTFNGNVPFVVEKC